LRGTLNYDGFVSIGSSVSAVGDFKLESRTVVNGGLFFLEIADKGLAIELLAGDSIHLEFDFNDIDQSLWASGRGAGKINLLRLEEFQHVQFENHENIGSVKSQLERDQASQMAIL